VAIEPELQLGGRLVRTLLTLRDMPPGAFIERRRACAASPRACGGRCRAWTPAKRAELLLARPPGHFLVTRLTEAKEGVSQLDSRQLAPRLIRPSAVVPGRVFKGPSG